MRICLYHQTLSEAIRLVNTTLYQLGFTIYFSDTRYGIIQTQKKSTRQAQIIFFDICISKNSNGIRITVISNTFSEDTCTFTADSISEEIFLERLHDLLRIQPPDNPLRLTSYDYAVAMNS